MYGTKHPLLVEWCDHTSVFHMWIIEYLCHKRPRYVPFVVNISRSFSHSWLITGFVSRLTWRVPLVEQELLTLLEHMSSRPGFSWVLVTQSLVLCVCFVDCCLSFCSFSFGHRVVCPSIYGFWFIFYIFKLFLNKSFTCNWVDSISLSNVNF